MIRYIWAIIEVEVYEMPVEILYHFNIFNVLENSPKETFLHDLHAFEKIGHSYITKLLFHYFFSPNIRLDNKIKNNFQFLHSEIFKIHKILWP
jgi:hypothetical protein